MGGSEQPWPGLTSSAAVWGAVLLILILLGLLGAAYRLTKAKNQRITALERDLLTEQQSNRSRTRFFAQASHDLRKPLHTLSMLCASLSLRTLDDKTNTIVSHIKRGVADLSHDLNAVLDISRLDADQMGNDPETIPVARLLVRLVASFAEVAAAKNLKLDYRPMADPLVHTDQALLERVLSQLIDNAIKFTDEGEVSVTLATLPTDPCRCEIVIADTGIGIAIGDQARIFEEFFQLNPVPQSRAPGLGLGLAIATRLARLMDAELDLTSIAGQGTRVVVRLTVVQGVAATGHESISAN